MSDRIAAINCTSCGGSLALHGGHRVRTLTCGYCGSVMDAHADYRVLEQFKNLKRPNSPLKIGMELTIKGVSQTVIGVIEYAMREEGITYSWISHQLYSPTHGYAWLTLEDGHFVFSYRVRDLPYPLKASHLPPRASIKAMGRTFLKYESGNAHIRYVEGELTWVAKVGDTVAETEAVDPPFIFSYESTHSEIEYSLGEYLDPETMAAALGSDEPVPAGHGIHPAQPFKAGALTRGAFWGGLIFAPIAVIALLVVLAVGGGTVIQRSTVADPATGGTVPFTATDASYLYQISLDTSISNSWAYYEVDLLRDGEDVEIGSLGRDIEYYSGTDSDGRWTEGSRTATATFHLPEPGDYELDVRLVEAENMQSNPPVTVEVRENVYVIRYVAALAIITVVAALFLPFRRRMFEAARWKPVTGDDDDDD